MTTWLEVLFLIGWIAIPMTLVLVPVTDAWWHSAFYERWTQRFRPRGRFTLALNLLVLFAMHVPLFGLALGLLWPGLLLAGVAS